MKKLFQGIKSDIKFKAAGPGHSLNEQKRDIAETVSKEKPKPPKPPPGEAQIAAGSAAIARIEGRCKAQSKDTIQMHVSKQQVSDQELNMRLDCKNIPASEKKSTVCNILFKCPLTGEILKKDEREPHIKKAIELLLVTDPISASIMKIHTFNKDREKVKMGVETISKYLSNIIANPNEEKYCSIKLSNKIFQERISGLEGSFEFFEAIGFEKKSLPVPQQEKQDEFYILSCKTRERLDDLQHYRDSLLSGEPIRASLERQPRIFTPSPQAAKFDLPDDFYNLSLEEIKLEQQKRKEKLEREAVLRTKAMREREEQREMKKYKYAILRIRFPDGYLLQGMFYAQEPLSALFDFVCQYLQNDWIPYELIAPCGQKLDNKEVSLFNCGLVPSALLAFRWDADVLADVKAAEGNTADCVLKQEFISSAETLY